jgi:tRNA pseudouridine32 synthase/23S rRNA pseudouridine746 synthase
MFGVLVVQHPSGELGYLAAFSGKLANSNHHPYFVPPVFDILTEDGFFRKGELEVNALNDALEKALVDPNYLALKEALKALEIEAQTHITAQKEQIKVLKSQRDERRKEGETSLDESAFQALVATLAQESVKEKFLLKDMTKHFEYRLADLREQIRPFEVAIEEYKEARKTKSAAIQQQLFDHYYFLNQAGKQKSLGAIFANMPDAKPPAGAGECAAPKLLHYAFIHQLKPLALAEFWWGQSPKSEVRVHQQYYPACRGKCEPILAHMLEGMALDPNPMLVNPAEGKSLPVVFEDDYLMVVNKPAEFLSVPGKNISDSVYERVKLMLPEATGPLIVHRLDMSTSGLLVIAKNKDVHEHLQRQFIKRTVNKRYVALLENEVRGDKGQIDLPLRVDLDDRPRQLVCNEHGKHAVTKWEVANRENGKTRIYFYPITGRTHQLRVHAAHPLGLSNPIIGDDLYGTKADRLHLHAETLEFSHPISRERLTIQVEAPF